MDQRKSDSASDMPAFPAPAPVGPGAPRGDGERPGRRWKLTDFVDVVALQRLQDGFAALCRAAVSMRDAEGKLITQPSSPNRFCTLLRSSPRAEELCRRSNFESAAQTAQAGRPAQYVCHAGLTQYAATIELEGQVLGTIVLGDRPRRALCQADVDDLAAAIGLDAATLREAAAEIRPWSDEEMEAAISFLQLLANAITALCYQAAVLRERVGELTMLEETSRMLAGSFDLDTVLQTVVRTMVEVMKVKACSLRLLDEAGKELIIKATWGLTPAYLKKGPVLVGENVHDRAALAGEVVRIADMAKDPRVRYPHEAENEGLVSSLGIGLFAGGRALGTLHIYTGQPHEFDEAEVRLFRTVAAQAASAIQNSKLLQEYVAKLQLEHELDLASEVQRRMLPKQPPQVPGLDIHALVQFSRQVGGDFYDFIIMPQGRTGIVIADTVGKSIPAALMAASVRSSLKAQAGSIYRISEVVERVNVMLCEDTLPSEFVTLFYGVIDARTKRMAYCNAGHDPPLLLRGGEALKLTAGGALLGVMPDASFEQESLQLQVGDVLLLYTDGIIDAASYNGQRYGRERLVESLKRHAVEKYTAEELAEQLVWDVRRFGGLNVRTDDLTLMVIRVNHI